MVGRSGRGWAWLAGIALAIFPAAPALAAPRGSDAINAGRPTIRLWPGSAPGTRDWTAKESELDADLPAGRVHIITNVTVPSLTVYRPAAGTATGAAAIVVPGGAFRTLAWDLEGAEVAQWLAQRGITAFVLKYRVRPPGASAPPGAETFDHFLVRTTPARRIAVADAVQALRLVRARARRLGIDPHRVGMIGFSAGAIATMDVATSGSAATRPDFVVSAYGALPDGRAVPHTAPPAFIVAARDDPQVPFANSVRIRDRWAAAHRPVELHLYDQGGHGFGIRKHGLPLDHWPDALAAWLTARGNAARSLRDAVPRAD